jgi:16S rRNA (uracil1498-N3)-methyltransferase
MPSLDSPGEEILLDSRNSRKILKVLRLQPGEEILLWDGEGREFRASIKKVLGTRVAVQIVERMQPKPEPPLRVVLVQGIPKGEKFDLIIQKATELGVWTISPVVTERTVVHIPEEKKAARQRRWQEIATEAARQSGRTHIPEVTAITPFSFIWQQLGPESFKLIFWEGETQSLKQVLRRVNLTEFSAVYLFIGPEGGFAKREIEEAVACGAVPVSLGPRVLRTETAGLVALSLVLYEWGDLGGP